MAGLLVQLIISWLLLRLFCKQGLQPLGLVPNKNRLLQFAFGFVVTASCCALYYLSFSVFTNNNWTLKEAVTLQKLLPSLSYTLTSVLYEELMFRGAVLYLLIRKLGITPACLLSAACFGVYHWFTMNAFGDPVQMMIVFGTTAIWGFMFALAFARTQSLYLPVALHLGWNLVNTVVFSQGPSGAQLLVLQGDEKMGPALSIVMFLFQVLAAPVVVCWYLQHRQKKYAKPVSA